MISSAAALRAVLGAALALAVSAHLCAAVQTGDAAPPTVAQSTVARPTAGPSGKTTGRFDGTWSTVLSCPNASGALGYSFEFPALIEHDVLHAEKGNPGEPGWLKIEGTIESDGTANLYASGLVGAAPYAVGQRPAGTQYGYHIEARFTDASGEGHRVEGRPCTVTFKRR